MSVRAELLRLALRLLKKWHSRKYVPIATARRRLKRVEAFVPRPPAGTQTTAIDAGGVNARRVAAGERGGRPDAQRGEPSDARERLPRRRRSAPSLCLSALRRRVRAAADTDSRRQRRDPARRLDPNGREIESGGMRRGNRG